MTFKIENNATLERTHELKTWVEYFEALIHPEKTLRKTLEIRKNDRDFGIGDVLVLKEYDPNHGYTGRQTFKRVTHILTGSPWLAEGYVAMSIIDVY